MNLMAERTRSKGLFIVLILTLVILIGLVLFSFFRIAGVVSLEVRGPSNLKSGESVFYTIVYENNVGRDLHDAEIRFFFPKNVELLEKPDVLIVERVEGFEVIKKISIVKAGRRARESFGAKIFGLPGEQIELKAAFIYGQDENSLIREEKFIALIEATPLSLNLRLPEQARIGSEFKFAVEYFNQGDFDIASTSGTFFKNIPNLELRLYYPDEFSFLSAERTPSRSGNVWFLAGVAKSSGGQFEISGRFGGEEGEEKLFRAEIGVVDAKGEFVVFARTETKTTLVGSALTVFQTVNESRDYVASPGEELNWRVSWRNSLSEAVENVVVELEFDSSALDLATLKVSGGTLDTFKKTVTWDKTQNPALATTRPTEGGTFSFSVKLKEDQPFNSSINATARILSPEAESLSFEDVLEIKVASQANIVARGFYYNSYFTNTGPIPPRVNQQTTYTIIWQVFNSSNELKDARVKAILPSNVQWLGVFQPKDEKIEFDNGTRQITWSIESLAVGVGLTSSPKEIRYEVSLLPDFSQVGRTPPLVSNILFEGFDVFSGLPVNVKAPDITTQLLDDLRVGYTGGIVQP